MDEITPIRFEATPLETEVITDTYHKERPAPVGGYRIKPVFMERRMDGKNFIEKHGFWLKEMLEEGDETEVVSDGWLKYQVPKVTGGRGSTNLYYRRGTLNFDDMLVNADGYGKMSIDHLHTVLQKEVFLIEKEFRVTADPNNHADLVFEKRIHGKIKVYAGEYEEEDSHTKEELIKKWGRLTKYDDYRFIASDTKFLIAAGIPEKYVVKRGKAFVDWIESLEESAETPAPTGGFENENETENKAIVEGENEEKTHTEDFIKSKMKKASVDSDNNAISPMINDESEVEITGNIEIGAV
jgi:hypothetical protein